MRLELEIRASESRRTLFKLCAGIQLWNPNHGRREQELVSPEVMASETDPGCCSVAVAGIDAFLHVTHQSLHFRV